MAASTICVKKHTGVSWGVGFSTHFLKSKQYDDTFDYKYIRYPPAARDTGTSFPMLELDELAKFAKTANS
jgi:hypothetical protein